MSFTHSSNLPDELLSAYIDHQITEAERRRVEASLAADPALQERLNDFKRTAMLLRNTPVVVAPRSFTLSEAQVLGANGNIRKTPSPAFWLRWMPRLAPALVMVVAVLFVFSLVGDLKNSALPAVPADQQNVAVLSQPAPTKSPEGSAEYSAPAQKLQDAGETAEKTPAEARSVMAEKPMASAQVESRAPETEREESASNASNSKSIEPEQPAEQETETASPATPEQPAPSAPAHLFSLQTIGLGVVLIALGIFVLSATFSRRQQH